VICQQTKHTWKGLELNEQRRFDQHWGSCCGNRSTRSVSSMAVAELALLQTPLLTCEAVCTETFFLLQRVRGGREAFITLLNRGLIQIPFHLGNHTEAVTELLNRYQSVPMSLADACLVKMAEEYEGSSVMTLDSDFQIYRKNRNQPIPLITLAWIIHQSFGEF